MNFSEMNSLIESCLSYKIREASSREVIIGGMERPWCIEYRCPCRKRWHSFLPYNLELSSLYTSLYLDALFQLASSY